MLQDKAFFVRKDAILQLSYNKKPKIGMFLIRELCMTPKTYIFSAIQSKNWKSKVNLHAKVLSDHVKTSTNFFTQKRE